MTHRKHSSDDRTWRFIRRAAVLGAGVMGAQIAAHLANVGLPVLLFDLAAPTKKTKNGPNPSPASLAIQRLAKLKPPPLVSTWRSELITPADYDHDLARLQNCDLIIEAIAERADLKQALYQRILPQLRATAILTTNTSGLSLTRLSAALPLARRQRFCGLHFFNPPRYMQLVELTPGPDTDATVLDTLETFVTRVLGKSVVRAKDSPNFIANRIGMLSMVGAIGLAEKMDLSPDQVDALTGTCLGRPKSATFRTLDLIGLDVLAHVIEDSITTQKRDPWLKWLTLPDWIQTRIEQGALGQKVGLGIYRKQHGQIQVFDRHLSDYRDRDSTLDPEVKAILRTRDWGEKLAALRQHPHPQAQFVWTLMRTAFHYSAWTLKDIANNARDLDLALRWGFGWQMGPLETWQAAGWRQVRDWIQHDIDQHAPMAEAPLPDWVKRVDGVHLLHGSYSPASDSFQPRTKLPVYQRQLFRQHVQGEDERSILQPQQTIFENSDARFWHQGDGVAILSFNTKMHTVGDGVLDAIMDATAIAETEYDGLILWQQQAPFCAGANLLQIAAAIEEQDFDAIDAMIERFQQATTRLRYCRIPTVAAINGLAIGGGCELLMHCDRNIAAMESYIGLVEVGVGVIPAGGGCKELARRAHQQSADGDPWPLLKKWFETVAMANVSSSAEHARELGFLHPADPIIMHPDELLFVARAQLRALCDSGYRAPIARPIRIAGRTAWANFQTQLVNLRQGGFISDHDLAITSLLARVLTGGDLDPGTLVDETWLLRQERHAFIELCKTEKTYQRITHTLMSGKPLRN